MKLGKLKAPEIFYTPEDIAVTVPENTIVEIEQGDKDGEVFKVRCGMYQKAWFSRKGLLKFVEVLE